MEYYYCEFIEDVSPVRIMADSDENATTLFLMEHGVARVSMIYKEVDRGQFKVVWENREVRVVDDLVLNEILDDDARDPDYYLEDN